MVDLLKQLNDDQNFERLLQAIHHSDEDVGSCGSGGGGGGGGECGSCQVG